MTTWHGNDGVVLPLGYPLHSDDMSSHCIIVVDGQYTQRIETIKENSAVGQLVCSLNVAGLTVDICN